MGTNYDVRYNICEKCGKYNDVHLGKSSMGWEFCFQGYPSLGIESVKKWKNFIELRNGKIYDEYDQCISWAGLMEYINKVKENKKHKSHKYAHYYKDPEGYCFTDMDFS